MLIYNSQPVLVAQQRAGADGPGRQQDLQEVPHSLAVTDLVTWLGALKTLEYPTPSTSSICIPAMSTFNVAS